MVIIMKVHRWERGRVFVDFPNLAPFEERLIAGVVTPAMDEGKIPGAKWFPYDHWSICVAAEATHVQSVLEALKELFQKDPRTGGIPICVQPFVPTVP